MPSALAVFRLSTVSNLVGVCTGRSPGLAPRSMRSMYEAACRYSCTKSMLGHKTAGSDKMPERIDCRQSVPGGKPDHEIAMQDRGRIRREGQTAVRHARK